MAFNKEKFYEALEQFDNDSIELECTECINELYNEPAARSKDELETIMNDLRKKRLFKAMVRLGDACMQTGRASLPIRKWFAQALIENSLFTAAFAVLNDLIADTKDDKSETAIYENSEAHALTGRIYKQLYVNASAPKQALLVTFMKNALQAYRKKYEDNTSEYIYHGINAVALTKRAAADNIDLSDKVPLDIKSVSKSLIDEVRRRKALDKVKPWDFAIAVEANVALDDYKEALEWAKEYVNSTKNAFEFGSTLRQLREVWQLDKEQEAQPLLTLIKGALLQSEGGGVTIQPEQLQQEIKTNQLSQKQAEKVFGVDSYKPYEWYMKGARSCQLIARIGRDTSTGLGTGFLLEGDLLLREDLKGRLVMLTNEHVINKNEHDREAVRPEEAVVSFEVLGINVESGVNEVFSSPYEELDVCIVTFEDKDEARLRKTLEEKKVDHFVKARILPKKKFGRVYTIGHPLGGSLQLSLQDNEFMDFEGYLLHYRTPTIEGSSGSPLFDGNWQLIGIHHAGGTIRQLNTDDKSKTHKANEGIMLNAIIEKINGS